MANMTYQLTEISITAYFPVMLLIAGLLSAVAGVIMSEG